MLNGKFYTGLPPEMMIERNNLSKNNRLQSNIFWPSDDINSDSADENRVKRRTSQQFQPPTEKLEMQRQISTESDVDAKQMFSKEFTKSSIEFYDNLDSNTNHNTKYKQKIPKKFGRQMKQDVTLKPTALKMEFPKDTIDEEYATTKKKEAFSSKIQFYDYVNDDIDKSNKEGKGYKIIRNDKKDVKSNIKNSPILQIKRHVNQINTNEFPKKYDQLILNKNIKNEIRRVSSDHQIPHNSLMKSNKSDRRDSQRLKDEVNLHNYEDELIGAGIKKFHIGYTSRTNNYHDDEYNAEIPKTEYYEHDKMTSQKPIKAKLEVTAHTSELKKPSMTTGNDQFNANRFNDFNFKNNEKHQYQDTDTDYSNKINKNHFQLNNNNQKSNIGAKIPTFESSDGETEATDNQKHLRSSICFFNDQKPLLKNHSQQRRNARSLAATQKVSVGLPD